MLLLPRRKLLRLGSAALAAPFIMRARADDLPLLGVGTTKKAVSGFNPTSLITGNGGFWRADMGVTQTSGNVTAWADQSSFANNLSNSSTPQYSSTAFNSSFPGITIKNFAALTCALSFSSTTFTVFMLLQEENPGGSRGRFCGFIGAGGGDDYDTTQNFEMDDGSSGNSLNCTWDNGQVGNSGSVGPSLTTGDLYLIGMSTDGTNGHRWVNGSEVTAATSMSTTIGGGASNFYVGATPSGGADDFIAAFVGLTYKSMSSTDWTNLKNWSNTNWGTSF